MLRLVICINVHVDMYIHVDDGQFEKIVNQY